MNSFTGVLVHTLFRAALAPALAQARIRSDLGSDWASDSVLR